MYSFACTSKLLFVFCVVAQIVEYIIMSDVVCESKMDVDDTQI